MKKSLTILLAVLMMFGLCIPASAEGYPGLNGNGTSSSPYLISGIDDWNTFVDAVNADPAHGEGLYFKLTGNVGSDGNETGSYVEEFRGSFNGAGYTVWISLDTDSLFAENYGTIENLCVRGSLSSFICCCGGVCGTNDGTVNHCANYASVSGFDLVGGICGTNKNTVVNCINYGPIEGDSRVGGICGSNDGSAALILNCVNAGTVTGRVFTAGICGDVQAYESGTPSGIVLCANCGLPTEQNTDGHYALLTCSIGGVHPELAWACHFVSPVNGVSCTASNDEDHRIAVDMKQNFADFLKDLNGHKIGEDKSDGIKKGFALTEWAIGDDGLPVFADSSELASTLSAGTIWIILAVAVVAVGTVSVLIVRKKKKS